MSYRFLSSNLPRTLKYGIQNTSQAICGCRCHLQKSEKRGYLMTVTKSCRNVSPSIVNKVNPATYVLSSNYPVSSLQDTSYFKSKYLIEPPRNLFTPGSNLFRQLHTSTRFLKEESKVEKTVKALKKAATDVAKKPVEESKEVVVKKTIWQRFVDVCKHYYHGFRLLFIDMRIAARMMWALLNGKTLSRREHRQLVRTTADLFRLVPFLVFLLVPFMEFLLPVAIKLFPNMLPSTFAEENKEQEKLKKQLKVKLEMAKFLQDTIHESALQGKKASGQSVQEFSDFMNQIRSQGIRPSTDQIIKFSKIFEDEITLDSLSHQQLQAVCRVLNVTPIGTDMFLRFQLKLKLRQLKADDKMIVKEGIESLSVRELQAACRARGMRALGVSEERLRLQLQQWLDLHLSENIPTSLLLLSRALFLPENLSTPEQLEATIVTLSETHAAEEAKLKVAELSGDQVDNKTKLDLIKHEEVVIKQEKEQQQQEEEEEKARQEEREEAEALAAQKAMESQEQLRDVAAILDVKPSEELKDVAGGEKAVEEMKEEEKISSKDLEEIESALEEIAEQKQLSIEKEELQDLKEEVEEYKEDLEDLKSMIVATGGSQEDLRESKAAQRLTKRVSRMIDQLDGVISGLHKEKEKYQEELEVKQVRMKWNKNQEDELTLQKMREEIAEEKESIISINEMVLALKRIQKVPDETKLQTILEVLDNDSDGIIDINDALKVIEILGQENVKLSKSQITEIMDLILAEESLEEEEKRKEKEEKEQTKQQEQEQQRKNEQQQQQQQ